MLAPSQRSQDLPTKPEWTARRRKKAKEVRNFRKVTHASWEPAQAMDLAKGHSMSRYLGYASRTEVSTQNRSLEMKQRNGAARHNATAFFFSVLHGNKKTLVNEQERCREKEQCTTLMGRADENKKNLNSRAKKKTRKLLYGRSASSNNLHNAPELFEEE